jgi:acyl carrier protein
MDIETKVARFISEKFGSGAGDQLKPDQSLFDEGLLDSVGIFELVDFLETEFGFEVGDEQIVPENFESVVAITKFVKQSRGDV